MHHNEGKAKHTNRKDKTNQRAPPPEVHHHPTITHKLALRLVVTSFPSAQQHVLCLVGSTAAEISTHCLEFGAVNPKTGVMIARYDGRTHVDQYGFI